MKIIGTQLNRSMKGEISFRVDFEATPAQLERLTAEALASGYAFDDKYQLIEYLCHIFSTGDFVHNSSFEGEVTPATRSKAKSLVKKFLT